MVTGDGLVVESLLAIPCRHRHIYRCVVGWIPVVRQAGLFFRIEKIRY